MKAKEKRVKVCPRCGNEFETYYGNQKYCSMQCAHRDWNKVRQPMDQLRKCRVCGKEFLPGWLERNKQHCSEECARESARLSRKKYWIRNPDAQRGYNRTRIRNHGPNNLTNRFFRKYPHIERKCMVCGETRVLDLHHIEARDGAWRLMSNTNPDNIWVLCPTCHALIERGVCTPEELELSIPTPLRLV